MIVFQHIAAVCVACLTIAFSAWEQPHSEITDDMAASMRARNPKMRSGSKFSFKLPENGLLGCCSDELDCDWGPFHFPPCDSESEPSNPEYCCSVRTVFTILVLALRLLFYIFDRRRKDLKNLGEDLKKPFFGKWEDAFCQTDDESLEMAMLEKIHQQKLEEMAQTIAFIQRQRRELELEMERKVFKMTYPPMVSLSSLGINSAQNERQQKSSADVDKDVLTTPPMSGGTRRLQEFIEPDYEWCSEFG